MSVTWLALGYSFFHIHLHQVWLWHLRLGSWLSLEWSMMKPSTFLNVNPSPPTSTLRPSDVIHMTGVPRPSPFFIALPLPWMQTKEQKWGLRKRLWFLIHDLFQKKKVSWWLRWLVLICIKKVCLWHLIFSQECISGNLFILFVASWGVLVLSLLCIRGVCVRGIPLCHQNCCA